MKEGNEGERRKERMKTDEKEMKEGREEERNDGNKKEIKF